MKAETNILLEIEGEKKPRQLHKKYLLKQTSLK